MKLSGRANRPNTRNCGCDVILNSHTSSVPGLNRFKFEPFMWRFRATEIPRPEVNRSMRRCNLLRSCSTVESDDDAVKNRYISGDAYTNRSVGARQSSDGTLTIRPWSQRVLISCSVNIYVNYSTFVKKNGGSTAHALN